MVPMDSLDNKPSTSKIEFWLFLLKDEYEGFDYGDFFHFLVFIREIILACEVSSFEMALNGGLPYFL